MTKLFKKANLFVSIVGISFMVALPVTKGRCAMPANNEITENDFEILNDFSEAVRTGDIPRAAKAINEGVDVNKLLGTGTPLELVILRGDKAMAKFLLEHGASISSRYGEGDTPLHEACIMSHNPAGAMKDIAALLIANGADLNARNIRGETPLHLLIESNGSIEFAELLIGKGANVNAKDSEGDTPLQSAVLFANKAMVELLIKNSADVNIKNNKGYTLLMRAAILSKYGEEIVGLLLSAGADVNAKNNDGETVLAILEVFKSHFPAYPDNIISLLKAHGATR